MPATLPHTVKDRWKDRAMGAAPVLIMLAAVGVDYGWQPDGTTSPRGDNIEYIVQISPDQLQQIRSIGEITSTIDPAVQGRVSRIVVKVGTGTLPKISGRVAVMGASTSSSPSSSLDGRTAIASGDDQLVPIPEIKDSVASRPNALNGLASTTSEPQSAAMMKPDPQGPGFQMPESVQNTAQSALDQVRNRANEMANQVGAQTRSTLETQQNSLTQGLSDATNRATATLQNGIDSALSPNASRTGTTPSIDTAAGRDNRWADISTRSATAPTIPAGPSTEPIDPNARTAPWAANPGTTGLGTTGLGATGATGAQDPRSLTTPSTQSPSLSNPYASSPTAFGTTAANSTARDPSDPKWSGYGNSPNFGSLPGVENPQAATPQATTPQAATPPFNQDSQGNYYDGLGRLVDRNGRLLPANATVAANPTANPTADATARTDRYGNALDANGFPVDRYGRRVDEYNRPFNDPRTTIDPRTANDPRLAASNVDPRAPADRFGGANPYEAAPFATSPYPQSAYTPSGTMPPSQASTLAQQQLEHELAMTRNQLRSYQQRDATAAQAQTRLVNFEEEGRSASDLQTTSQRLRAEQERNAAQHTLQSKPRTISGQPFVVFVLLISLVGNAYLIFETNNLRRKFRNMINSVRSSKVTAQPAT
jgi:hypothetical protein